jgi:hypothetical protein
MKKNILSELLLEIAVFLSAVILIVLFWGNNLLLSALLIGLLLLANQFWYKKYDYVIYIAAIALGSMLDLTASHFGIWEFTNPSFLNLPLWLPMGWVLGAITILKTYETLKKLMK